MGLHTYPKISVITVVFNRVEQVELTLNSVTHQTYPNLEYIVIDGGSTDGTLACVKKYESKIATWFSEPDKGIYDAMNKGISHATGDWIIFMNAGDFFYQNNSIESAFAQIDKPEKYEIIYGDAEIKAGNKKHVQYQKGRHLNLKKSVIHQSMFIKRTYLKRNPYDLQYRIMADYDNLLHLTALHADRCKHIDVIICQYDMTGVSSQPLYRYFGEYYRIAFKRMPLLKFIDFNMYIFPRFVWSLRHLFT